jgi:hypothetical protein
MGRLTRGLRREVTRRYAPEMQIMAQLGPLLLVRPIHEDPTSNDRVPTLRGKSVRGQSEKSPALPERLVFLSRADVHATSEKCQLLTFALCPVSDLLRRGPVTLVQVHLPQFIPRQAKNIAVSLPIPATTGSSPASIISAALAYPPPIPSRKCRCKSGLPDGTRQVMSA